MSTAGQRPFPMLSILSSPVQADSIWCLWISSLNLTLWCPWLRLPYLGNRSVILTVHQLSSLLITWIAHAHFSSLLQLLCWLHLSVPWPTRPSSSLNVTLIIFLSIAHCVVLNFLSALLYPALAQGSIGAEAFIFFSIRQHLVVAYLAIYFRSLNFSDAYCGQCLLYKLLKRGLLFYQVLSFCLFVIIFVLPAQHVRKVQI